jgi:hypothetical protein
MDGGGGGGANPGGCREQEGIELPAPAATALAAAQTNLPFGHGLVM